MHHLPRALAPSLFARRRCGRARGIRNAKATPPGRPGGGKPALPHRGTRLSPPLAGAVTPYLRMCMVISTLIAGLLAAALGPTALYSGVLVPTLPWPPEAAAITATALLLAAAVRRRRSTAVALVPALRRGRRR